MKEYIDREQALNFDISVECDPDDLEKIMEGMARYAEYVKALPAANVRPLRRGEWLVIAGNGKFGDSCACSVCKKSPPIPAWVVKGFVACPYCVADMRGIMKEENNEKF